MSIRSSKVSSVVVPEVKDIGVTAVLQYRSHHFDTPALSSSH